MPPFRSPKFVANKGIRGEAANCSFVLRGYVRHWLANVWSEYDRIKLTDIVGSGKPEIVTPTAWRASKTMS